MAFTPDQLQAIRKWMTKRLDEISEAEPEILADFVLALLEPTKSEEAFCMEAMKHLPELLTGDAQTFINDLLAHCLLVTKQLSPDNTHPASVAPPAPYLPKVRTALGQTRKRAHLEIIDRNERQHSNHIKHHSRRGGRGLHDLRPTRGQSASTSPYSTSHSSLFRFPSTFSTGLPAQVIPDDLAANFPYLAAMMNPFPGVPLLPRNASNRSRPTCWNYNTFGYCLMAEACPYAHGVERPVAPATNEYDPKNALSDYANRRSLDTQVQKNQSAPRNLVPAEQAEEQAESSDARRSTSANFVAELEHYHDTMIDSARNVVDHNTASDAPYPQATGLEIVAECERACVEREVQLEKIQEARKGGECRFNETIERIEKEKAVLIAKIATKEARSASLSKVETPKSDAKQSKSQALREHLARLEAEARSLGIDPDAISEAPTSSFVPNHRGRGSGSSRGHYGRQTGYSRTTYGGSYQVPALSYSFSSGSSELPQRTSVKAPAVLKLDNRPRDIAVWGSGWVFDAQKEEMLRAYLVRLCEYESLGTNPENTEQLIIRFKERWQAERLMNGKRDIAGVGMVELKWVAGAPPMTTTQAVTEVKSDVGDGDEIMKDVFDQGTDGGICHEPHENLDVAEEDDWHQIT